MLHRPTGLTIIITVLALVSAPILGFSEVFGSEPFLGQIVMLGTNFAPRGFALCNGQILPINQNQSLYSLLGTTYGGDGRTSFALPDLRGRSPMHRANGQTNRALGQKLGTETVSISVSQLPPHNHGLRGSTGPGNSTSPAGAHLAIDAREDQYLTGVTPDVDMGANATTSVGSSQGHPNMQPSLCVTFVIALQGLFPSRN